MKLFLAGTLLLSAFEVVFSGNKLSDNLSDNGHTNSKQVTHTFNSADVSSIIDNIIPYCEHLQIEHKKYIQEQLTNKNLNFIKFNTIFIRLLADLANGIKIETDGSMKKIPVADTSIMKMISVDYFLNGVELPENYFVIKDHTTKYNKLTHSFTSVDVASIIDKLYPYCRLEFVHKKRIQEILIDKDLNFLELKTLFHCLVEDFSKGFTNEETLDKDGHSLIISGIDTSMLKMIDLEYFLEGVKFPENYFSDN